MLLIGGWRWAATSPLIYTLQRYSKYAHFGYTKRFTSSLNTYIYERVCNNTWENYDSYEPSSHRMNLTVDLEPLHDFSTAHFTQLMTGDHTISKEIDFFHALHDHVVTKGYKSVGIMLTNQQKYSELLMSEFDIKVLWIARDPVRRAFAEFLYHAKVSHDCYGLNEKMSEEDIIEVAPSAFMRVKSIIPKKRTDYMNRINRFNEKFGEDKTHVVVMEELWEGDGTAKKELSDFLDHPITDLWKNLYSPDRGHHVKYDKDVPCQAYAQDLFELTPKLYNIIKKYYQHIYDDWENHFGSLPLHWGQPITYS